jgi:hypothetical protein
MAKITVIESLQEIKVYMKADVRCSHIQNMGKYNFSDCSDHQSNITALSIVKR